MNENTNGWVIHEDRDNYQSPWGPSMVPINWSLEESQAELDSLFELSDDPDGGKGKWEWAAEGTYADSRW
jgi:hypothetical protein